MMADPYDEKRIILALQVDHSPVAGHFAAHWGNQKFARPQPDPLARFVCNRYPLNRKARKLGPSNSLNEVGVPTKHCQPALKVNVDTVGENKAMPHPDPFDMDPLPVSFNARLVPPQLTKTVKIVSVRFIAPSAAPCNTRWPRRSERGCFCK